MLDILILLAAAAVSFLFGVVAELMFGYSSYFESGAIFYSIVAWQTWEKKNLRIPIFVAGLIGWLTIGNYGALVSVSRHDHSLLSCPFDACCGLSGIASGLAGASILVLGTLLLLPQYPKMSSPKSVFQISLRHIIWGICMLTPIFAAFAPGIQQNSETRIVRENLLDNIDPIAFRDAGREVLDGKSLLQRNQEDINLDELPDIIAKTKPSRAFVAYGYLALLYGPYENVMLIVRQKGDNSSQGRKLVEGFYYRER
ncbi:MAG: hypothetical protein AAF623_15845 [Planctomycetota bacterium]